MQQSIYAAFLFLFAINALSASGGTGFKIDELEIRTSHANGKTQESKVVKLQAQPDGAMRLFIPIRAIEPGTDTIEVHMPFAKAQKGDDGYAILTANNICSFTQDNGIFENRNMGLPVVGMKTPSGTFVAMVKGLRFEFSTVLEAKNGAYEMYLKFLIAEIGFDPYEDIVVDFYPLYGKEANYVGMAKKYRKWQLERGEVLPLKERVKNNPRLKYMVESIFVRVKHGQKKMMEERNADQSPDTEPYMYVWNTFDDAMDLMREMNSAGIEKANMCFVGWNIGGFDGRFPDFFPVEERFGGESKMREAVELGKKFGYMMTNHVNYTDFCRIAKRFCEDDIAKKPNGMLRLFYTRIVGGRSFNPCFQRVCDRMSDNDLKAIAGLGMNGPQYIDVLSAITPWPCFDPRHPVNRKQCAEYQMKVAKKCHNIFGGFNSECGFDHLAPLLDYCLYTTNFYKRKEFEKRKLWPPLSHANMLDDRIIPFWQIIYHGIISSQPDWGTLNHTTFPKSDDRRLKVIEYGGRPTFYDMRCKKSIGPILEAYNEYLPLVYLQYEFIDDHRELAKDVFVTVYSDGSEIVTNYSKNSYQYKGEGVPARDFKLFKPTNN